MTGSDSTANQQEGKQAARILPDTLHTYLQDARDWWQEGDRSLDYLAERSRTQYQLDQVQAFLRRWQSEPVWTAEMLHELFPLLRALSPNSAINRTLAADSFAAALRNLLFSDAPLPRRLTDFFAAT